MAIDLNDSYSKTPIGKKRSNALDENLLIT